MIIGTFFNNAKIVFVSTINNELIFCDPWKEFCHSEHTPMRPNAANQNSRSSLLSPGISQRAHQAIRLITAAEPLRGLVSMPHRCSFTAFLIPLSQPGKEGIHIAIYTHHVPYFAAERLISLVRSSRVSRCVFCAHRAIPCDRARGSLRTLRARLQRSRVHRCVHLASVRRHRMVLGRPLAAPAAVCER
jgi:hypothetical protein